MSYTFEWQGKRKKSVSHKNLYFGTKSSPLVVRWGKHGVGQYGPYAYFEVMGDASGEYCYNPVGKDESWPDEVVQKIMKQVDNCGENWVKVHASFGENDSPALVMEDEQGNPIMADDQQWGVKEVAEAFDAEPANEAARQAIQGIQNEAEVAGPPLQASGEKLQRCAIIAGGIVDAFQEHLGRPMTEHDRTIAITLFIESNKRF